MKAVRFAVDQHQVGAEVAVPVVLPRTRQGVVPVTRGQRPVGGQFGDGFQQAGVQSPAESALFLALVVPFEGGGAPNRPHSGRP